MIQPQMITPIMNLNNSQAAPIPGTVNPMVPPAPQPVQKQPEVISPKSEEATNISIEPQAKSLTQKIKEWFAPIQSADNRLVDTGYNPKKRVWNFSPEWV
jgi:hypothetical protein